MPRTIQQGRNMVQPLWAPLSDAQGPWITVALMLTVEVPGGSRKPLLQKVSCYHDALDLVGHLADLGGLTRPSRWSVLAPDLRFPVCGVSAASGGV